MPSRDRQTLEGSLNLASLPSTKPAWLGCVHQNNQTELHYVHTRLCRPVNKVLCRNLWHRFVLLPCQPVNPVCNHSCRMQWFIVSATSAQRPSGAIATPDPPPPVVTQFVWQTPCSAAMDTLLKIQGNKGTSRKLEVRRCADGVSVTAVATYSYNHPESTLVRAPIT